MCVKCVTVGYGGHLRGLECVRQLCKGEGDGEVQIKGEERKEELRGLNMDTTQTTINRSRRISLTIHNIIMYHPIISTSPNGEISKY